MKRQASVGMTDLAAGGYSSLAMFQRKSGPFAILRAPPRVDETVRLGAISRLFDPFRAKVAHPRNMPAAREPSTRGKPARKRGGNLNGALNERQVSGRRGEAPNGSNVGVGCRAPGRMDGRRMRTS